MKKAEPRMNSFKIDKYVSKFKKSGKDIKSVRLDIISFDDEFEKDVKRGKGFLITNEVDFDDKTGVRTIDGLYSPNYGLTSFNDKITDDCYHCECGETVGSLMEGEVCPKCGTKVQFIDSGLDIFGYIPLGEFSIINPAIYTLLIKLIGEKDLQSIIKFNNKFNVMGKNVSDSTKASPYNGIGIIEFKKRFSEIIEYYRDKRKQYDCYRIIHRFEHCVFAKYIPVYSSLLRPFAKDDSKIGTVDNNISYGIILANANIVRNASVPGIDKKVIFENCLFEIQTEFNNIYKDIIENSLSSKKGVIRGQVTCNRLDYSGRCVIVPAIGNKVDEVSIPYAMGVELFRPLIIHSLTISRNVSERQANMQVDEALRTFDRSIWFIMNHIVTKSKNPPMLMIQRSPSLLQESMRLMRIKIVKADFNDYTMNVPTSILKNMNADFDGDTMAIYCIYDNRLKESWVRLHSPINHFVSRHTGKYSDGGSLIKDTAVILSELWELGKNETYYEYQASDAEREEHILKITEGDNDEQ